MERSQLDRETIHERALAQPKVDHGEVVSEVEALAFFEDLRQNNPVLHSHIKEVIQSVDDTLAAELGTDVTPLVRRAIIARAAIASAAQTMSDTGQSTLEIDEFRTSLGIIVEQVPVTKE